MRLTKSQLVAVSTFLTEWDNTLSYQQILEEVVNDQMVVVWEPFEGADMQDVADHIENLRMFCETVYGRDV